MSRCAIKARNCLRFSDFESKLSHRGCNLSVAEIVARHVFLVGIARFELTTSCSQSRHSNRAELYPACFGRLIFGRKRMQRYNNYCIFPNFPVVFMRFLSKIFNFCTLTCHLTQNYLQITTEQRTSHEMRCLFVSAKFG